MTEQEFQNQIKANIAPIYFFDPAKTPIVGGNQNTSNGTLTLYRNGHIILGITNHHVYSESLKEGNICQIGNKFQIHLQQRLVHADEENDLVVIYLEQKDLDQIGDKHGFTLLDYDISQVLHRYQKEGDPHTWACHIVGFYSKETEQIDSEKQLFQENFDACPYMCYARFCPENNEITLNISRTKEAVEAGQIGGIKFPEHFSFAGMSGGPVFARIARNDDPYSNAKQLSLVGVIHEGSAELGMEIVKARPISLLKDVLEKV